MFQLTLQLAYTGREISGTDIFSLKTNPTLYRDSDTLMTHMLHLTLICTAAQAR